MKAHRRMRAEIPGEPLLFLCACAALGAKDGAYVKAPVDILVITAHPDDAEFGAAGSVARWIAEGRCAAYVVCTSGEKGTTDRTLAPEALLQMREQEQQAAADLLGVREVEFLRYP
ncbi:MAG: PIG-L family deacetylase, partial [Desulfobacteraceae bacterium]